MKIDLVKQFYQLTKVWDSKSEGFDLKTYLSQNVGYLFFLTVLIGIYIGNAHLVERKVRLLKKENAELQKLKWEFFTLQSNVLSDGMVSNVYNSVEEIGLEPLSEKPEKLIVVLDEQ